MRNVLFLVLCLFLFTLSTPAVAAPITQDSPTLPALLTMNEALRIFREHGLDLLIAEATILSAEGDVKSAGAVPNPNANLGAYRSFYVGNLFEVEWGWSAGLGDSNAIEDTLSGKRFLRTKVAQAALRAARLSRLDAERTLSYQVKQAYIQAVLARDALDFALEVQKSSTQSFDLTHLRLVKGAISEADEAKVETAKLESDQAVTQAQQSLEVTKVTLAFLLGVRDRIPPYKVEQDLPKYRMPPGLVGATPDSLLLEAIDNRPDLRGIKEQRKRAEASLELARRLLFPDISLNLQYTAQGSPGGKTGVDAMGNPSTITPISPPTIQLFLTGTLPVFYQQQGEIKKAEADVRTQSATTSKVEAQVLADVTSSYLSLVGTSELVGRMESRLLDRSRRARDLVKIQFDKGSASLLEFLDAQRTFIATNVEYLNDLTNYWTAVFQLEQAVGKDLR